MPINDRTDQTIKFALWPHMITIEGPADALATVIEDLYGDPKLPRDQWGLGSSSSEGRLAMVMRLRSMGKATRRVGLAALSRAVSDAIETRVRAAKVKCNAMHMPEK